MVFTIFNGSLVFSCDPILESLILSKSSINSIDMLFREFSTKLGQLGREARNSKIDMDTLVNTKLVWLKVYEKYYLYPPDTINHKHWTQSIDKIAKLIKSISLGASTSDFETTHTDILKIQTTLVSIYDGSQNKSFFAKSKMIQHLFHLHKKSKLEELEEDAKLIKDRLHIEWNELVNYFSTKDKILLNLDTKFSKLQNMGLDEYNVQKETIFKQLDEMYWNSQDQ